MKPKESPEPVEPLPVTDEWGLPIPPPASAATDTELGLTTDDTGDDW